MLTSKQIEESERLDREFGPRPDCRRESLMPRIRAPRTAQSERSRLEREVIEAAIHERRADLALADYWRKREADPDYDPDSAALFALVNDSGRLAHNTAVDALLAFEHEA